MLFKRLFSRHYWWATLIVIAGMLFLARLGVWQLDRRQQRLAANAELQAKLAAQPLSLNEAAGASQWPLSQDRDEIRNTRGSAAGRFDYANEVLLVQQNLDVMPGAHLVAPLLLDGSDKAVLVDRGWIPAAEAASGQWRQFDDEVGPVVVTGFLQPSQILFGKAAERAAQNQAVPASPQSEWHRVDVEAIQAQLPYELLPVYLLQSPPPEGNLTLPIHVEPEIDLSEGPHLGYALQWFAFSLVLGVLYLRYVATRREPGGQEADVVPARELELPRAGRERPA